MTDIERIAYEVAEFEHPDPWPFAVIAFDPAKRETVGDQGTVVSVHMSRDEAKLKAAVANYEWEMREVTIPAIIAEQKEQARRAHYFRLGIPDPKRSPQ